MFTFIHSINLEIDLDPVKTEDHYHPSVAFDITAIWEMPFQKAKIEINECWFENSELNQFQENLQILFEKRTDSVNLCDMSLKPIFQFNRLNEEIIFELNVQDSFLMGTITLRTEIADQELLEILERMKSWAKWW